MKIQRKTSSTKIQIQTSQIKNQKDKGTLDVFVRDIHNCAESVLEVYSVHWLWYFYTPSQILNSVTLTTNTYSSLVECTDAYRKQRHGNVVMVLVRMQFPRSGASWLCSPGSTWWTETLSLNYKQKQGEYGNHLE
jgi:hypothetical protein